MHFCIFRQNGNKKCIYTMYIYSKCAKKRKKWQVSYGYPMGKLWVSYGKGRYLSAKKVLKGAYYS